MEDLSNRVVETLRKFQEADRRLATSGRPGSEREARAREYVRARDEHQAAVDAVGEAMKKAGER